MQTPPAVPILPLSFVSFLGGNVALVAHMRASCFSSLGKFCQDAFSVALAVFTVSAGFCGTINSLSLALLFPPYGRQREADPQIQAHAWFYQGVATATMTAAAVAMAAAVATVAAATVAAAVALHRVNKRSNPLIVTIADGDAGASAASATDTFQRLHQCQNESTSCCSYSALLGWRYCC